MALSMRMARLQALVRERAGNLDMLLDSTEQAGRRCQEGLRRRSAKPGASLSLEAMKNYGETVLAARLAEVREIRAGAEAREQNQARIVDSILRAESALIHPDTMANQAALGRLGIDLAGLESDPAWRALPAGMRARAHLARAISAAIVGLLRGERGVEVRNRCAAPALKAFALDGKVVARWRERLSPRILALLKEIKPQ